MSQNVTLHPLDPAYLDAAAELAQAEYDRERSFVPALAAADHRAFYRAQLAPLFTEGLGALALQNGTLAGFLAFCAPFDTGDDGMRGASAPRYCSLPAALWRAMASGDCLSRTGRSIPPRAASGTGILQTMPSP